MLGSFFTSPVSKAFDTLKQAVIEFVEEEDIPGLSGRAHTQRREKERLSKPGFSGPFPHQPCQQQRGKSTSADQFQMPPHSLTQSWRDEQNVGQLQIEPDIQEVRSPPTKERLTSELQSQLHGLVQPTRLQTANQGVSVPSTVATGTTLPHQDNVEHNKDHLGKLQNDSWNARSLVKQKTVRSQDESFHRGQQVNREESHQDSTEQIGDSPQHSPALNQPKSTKMIQLPLTDYAESSEETSKASEQAHTIRSGDQLPECGEKLHHSTSYPWKLAESEEAKRENQPSNHHLRSPSSPHDQHVLVESHPNLLVGHKVSIGTVVPMPTVADQPHSPSRFSVSRIVHFAGDSNSQQDHETLGQKLKVTASFLQSAQAEAFEEPREGIKRLRAMLLDAHISLDDCLGPLAIDKTSLPRLGEPKSWSDAEETVSCTSEPLFPRPRSLSPQGSAAYDRFLGSVPGRPIVASPFRPISAAPAYPGSLDLTQVPQLKSPWWRLSHTRTVFSEMGSRVEADPQMDSFLTSILVEPQLRGLFTWSYDSVPEYTPAGGLITLPIDEVGMSSNLQYGMNVLHPPPSWAMKNEGKRWYTGEHIPKCLAQRFGSTKVLAPRF
ncbi:unnamed protein product [Protopolystoma xenopodis]|uniref:Uncharacterized protein n=1 Tax=Protopolystoma xenopodis TaxID=117903 RepID=A0A448XF88_9PLAT|nr:unnamed protein product [Protopolystoma xenopodis]